MRPCRVGMIGAGFVARAHVEGLRRLGWVEVTMIASAHLPSARALADEFGIGCASANYADVVADPEIEVVHVCTPNALHFAMVKAALEAGKHVLCEKPLALTAAEAAALAALAVERNLRHCTCYNLRYYPLVRQMRCLRESGELGEILAVQGSYVQDWLLEESDWNWRLDPAVNGASRALADIGSHWCDMAEYVSGLPIRAVCADLQTFHRHRERPREEVKAFAGPGAVDSGRERVPAATEDFASCLLHLGERARGAFTVNQMAAGRKNQLRLEVFGTRASVAWDQESPNHLWVGSRRKGNAVWLKDPAALAPEARDLAAYPGGHAEGYPDTFKQLFRRFYASVRDPGAPRDYPQFEDGLRQLQIVESQLASHRSRQWCDVAVEPAQDA